MATIAVLRRCGQVMGSSGAKVAGVRWVTVKWGMGVAGQPAEGVETGAGSRFFPGSPA
jgi:hypothetical protein